MAARWKEEVDLLEEEMRRTVCFFSFYQGKWERESGARETRGDAGGAAYACVTRLSWAWRAVTQGTGCRPEGLIEPPEGSLRDLAAA